MTAPTDGERRTYQFVKLTKRVQEVARQHGSLRAAARALTVDHAYLSRLQSGEKTDPSEAVLRKLGLRRLVLYARVKPHG